MLLELHCHTSRFSSCSKLDPVTLVKSILKKGLQGLVITEHNYQWKHSDLLELKKMAEVDESFVILSGQEVDTDRGHVLVYGAQNIIEKDTPVAKIRESFPDAALALAHPFRNDRIPSEEKVQKKYFDAIEIFNSNHTPRGNYRALQNWHRYKYTAIGGSDCHDSRIAGMFPTIFDHPVTSIEDLVTEIKNGRCRPFFKEIPKAGTNIDVTEITIGTKGDDESRQRIVVKHIKDNKKWQEQLKPFNLINTLLDSGFNKGKFRVPKIIEINKREKILIEEGQRGKSFFDLLYLVNPAVGKEYCRLSALWLAKMHKTPVKPESADDAFVNEQIKIKRYKRSFTKTKNPHTNAAHEILEYIESAESSLLKNGSQPLVHNHGDFHPKNIIIGQDLSHDISTVFISVIDFDNTSVFLPAYDLGYFFAQYLYQFRELQGELRTIDMEWFLDVYRNAIDFEIPDMMQQVMLFKLRGLMSIASFLIKVGKGESRDMDDIIGESSAIKESLHY